MRRLIVPPEISRRIGACGLSRNALVRLYADLRYDLERRYQIYRSSRHPDDGRYFLYLLAVGDGPVTHRFTFIVDDSTTPDHMFINDFRRRESPA